MGAAAVVLLALWLFLEKTSFGLIIRAGARDPQIVRVLGVDVAQVWLIVSAIGTAIAGFAGVLAAPLQGVIPEMGGTILAEAFVVTVVGGMGSIGGAVLAGLLVGVVISMTSLFAPEMSKVSIFALMAIVSDRAAARVLRPRRIDELTMTSRTNEMIQPCDGRRPARRLARFRDAPPGQPRQPGRADVSAGDAVHRACREYPDLRSLRARL